MTSGVGKALVSAPALAPGRLAPAGSRPERGISVRPSLSFRAARPAKDKYSPNSLTNLKVMFLVAAQSVFVVRMVLITSSKRVGERRTRPRARFLARASFGSPREAA